MDKNTKKQYTYAKIMDKLLIKTKKQLASFHMKHFDEMVLIERFMELTWQIKSVKLEHVPIGAQL